MWDLWPRFCCQGHREEQFFEIWPLSILMPLPSDWPPPLLPKQQPFNWSPQSPQPPCSFYPLLSMLCNSDHSPVRELLSLPSASGKIQPPIPQAFAIYLPASPPLHSSPMSSHHALLPFCRHTKRIHSFMPSLDSIWRISTHFSRPYSHIPSSKKTSVTPQGLVGADPGNRLKGPALLKALQA